jgi:hypothetical protein
MQENTTACTTNYPKVIGQRLDSLQIVAYIWKFQSVRV